MDEYVVTLTYPVDGTRADERAHEVVDDLAGIGLSPAVATPGGMLELTVSMLASGAFAATERAVRVAHDRARLPAEPTSVMTLTAAEFDLA